MIKKLMTRLYMWLEIRLGIPKHVCPQFPPIPDNVLIIPEYIEDILPAALEIIMALEKVPDVSGEWKRHQCFAKLIKKYPDIRKRDLALAIEIVVQQYDI